MKRYIYTAEDKSGPEGMQHCPYIDKDSREYHTYVDFACAFEGRPLTLDEVAKYHGIPVDYYTPAVIDTLIRDGVLQEVQA